MPKSLSKTPAPKKDRIYGSDKNKVGSASSKASAKGIELSESIIATLSQKAKDYNENHPNSKVSVATLKAVMRRGMGAYSTSHRPTITGGAPNSRQAWGFARVNKFLKKKAGQQVKAAYVQDDDLMADGGETKKSKEAYTLVGVYTSTNELGREESEDLTKEGLLGYRIRYNKMPKDYYGYTAYENTESDLERAKSHVARYNKEVEDEKQRKKARDLENKIKREKQKIIDAQKLEAAKSDDTPKPAYLMTKSEYEDRVIPLLKEYEKFARKNSEYLANTSYSGLYKTTYEQVLSRALEGKNTGRRFDADSEKGAIKKWNYIKFSRYADEKMEIPAPTPKDILEKNISFFKDLNKFFSDKVIFDNLDSEYKKSNKAEIRRAIEDDTYKKMIENGEITEDEVIKIAEEQGVKVPKKVFTQESLLKKEAKKQMDEILSKIPKMNQEVFESLYKQLFDDFKDVEKIVIEQETERFEGLIKEYIELSEKEGGVNVERLQTAIVFWKIIFKKTEPLVIKSKDDRGYTITEYFFKNLKLEANYKPVLDKIILDYAESLKYRFLKAVLDNFPRVSKPISNITRKSIKVGKKGFEGRYRFNFADGSYFDFVTEAIPAAGYNIVAFHYRYLTHLENATLADGTKVKGYYEIMQNFSSDSMADGGEVGLTEIAQDVYISKDKDKLPKDATIVIHRYNDDIKAGELGLFAGNLEDMELDDGYGKNKAYISIGKNAKVKKIRSTSRYLEDLGEFDKPREYIQEKYGKESLLDLMDDAGSLYNPSDAWYETQKVAISKMREAGEDFDVLEMTYEEDYIPHQYLITTLKNSKIKFKDGGQIYADGGQTGQAITCVNCGWHWNTSDSDESDKYICHKCGFDNRTFYDPEPIGKMADGGVIEKGQLIEYSHSDGGSVEAKFLSKVGENKAKIEILNNYTPYTKRVLRTEYLNPAGRTQPANLLKEIPRGTIKIVSLNLIEPVTEKTFKHRAKPISKWLKSTEFKEAFGHLDNPINTMANGGALGKSKVYYHGSNTLFKNIKFLENKSGESKHLGDGIYITNDINVAKKYGTYLYEIIAEEPLKSLNYSSAVSKKDMVEIIDIFKNSDDDDLNYLATEYQDDLDDGDLLWGKQLIADLERNGVDVYNTLLDLGYNSIVSPINKLNSFLGWDESSLNINVIKPNILHIISVKTENDKEVNYAQGGVMGQELFKPSKTIEQIAKEKDVPLEYAEEQLRKGIKTESEHSDNPMVQETIALQHLDEMIDYYEKLEYMESKDKMEKGGVTQFYKEYLDWYKDGVFNEMTIMVSVPNSFSKMSGGENDVILDVFEKKDESVNAKEKMKELLEIVDRNGLDIYLEPIPRLYNIKDKAKREKITREYLIKYYENFGFELLPNGFMVRKHNKMEKGGYYKAGGEINPDNKAVKDYFAHGSGNAGGVLVGKRHSEGGIKAVNKSTNQPLEMEGGEVVITRNAVSDTTKREFNGEMLTNREILSKINESGGGVSFAKGGDIPETISTSGKEYKYGGKMMKDHEIVSSCGCNHSMADGGKVKGKLSAELIHIENAIEYYKNDSLINPTKEQKLNWEIFGLADGIEKIEQKFETTIDVFFGNTKKDIENQYNEKLSSGYYDYLGLNPQIILKYNNKMAEGGEIEKIKVQRTKSYDDRELISILEYIPNEREYVNIFSLNDKDRQKAVKNNYDLSKDEDVIKFYEKVEKGYLADGGETDYHNEIKNHLFPKVEVEVEVEIEPEMDVMPIHEHYITADDLGLSEGMPMLAVGTLVYSSGGNDQWEVVSFSDDGVNLVNKPKSPLQSKMEDKHLTFEELIKYFKDKAISIKNISTERELEPAIALVKNKLPQKSFAVGGLIDGDEDEDAKLMQSQFGKTNFK